MNSDNDINLHAAAKSLVSRKSDNARFVLGVILLGFFFTLLIFPLLGSLLFIDQEVFSVFIAYIKAYFLDHRSVTAFVDGQLYEYIGIDFASHKWVKGKVFHVLLTWGLSAALGFSVYFFFARRFVIAISKRTGKGETVRGAIILDFEEAKSIVEEKSSDLTIGGLPYPNSWEPTHLFLSGDSGAGKTSLLFELLDSITIRGDKVFFFDRSGGMTERYYRDGDVILNPFDERSLGWSVFNEIETAFDFNQIATSWIPDTKNSSDSHWVDAPRITLSNLLKVLYGSDDMNHSTLTKIAANYSIEEVHALLADTPAQRYTDPNNDKHASSVLSLLIKCVEPLKYLSDEAGDVFSIKKWVADPNDTRRVFLNPSENQMAALGTIFTLWCDIAINKLVSLDEDSRRSIWFSFDEFQSLKKLSSAQALVEEGRKYGGKAIFSVTSIPSLVDTWGEQGARKLISPCSTKVILKNGEPDSAKFLSNLFGESEIVRTVVSTTEGNSTSKSISSHKEKSPIISPTEIQNLNKFNAYLKSPDINAVKIKTNPDLPHTVIAEKRINSKVADIVIKSTGEVIKSSPQDDLELTAAKEPVFEERASVPSPVKPRKAKKSKGNDNQLGLL